MLEKHYDNVFQSRYEMPPSHQFYETTQLQGVTLVSREAGEPLTPIPFEFTSDPGILEAYEGMLVAPHTYGWASARGLLMATTSIGNWAPASSTGRCKIASRHHRR